MRQPNQQEWQAIWQLFDRLVALPKGAREPEIARAKIGPFIVEQVRSLLRAEESGGMLDATASPPQEGGAEYASLSTGATVGPFRVLRLIGRGGMGEVYLAERVGGGFEQKVALKMLRPEAVARASWFESERKLLAGLEHPGIARLIDGGIADDGRAYMAMEYVEGEDIGRWCARTRAVLGERLRLFLDVCDAVSHAHARLVVHRDIKLANIMIDTAGRARLLDFGIARLVDEAAADHTMTLAMLTPDYAAPEQLENARVTVATDVYALGAVLYELLTGTGPWRTGAASVSSIIRRALHDDPPAPSKLARERGESPVSPQRIAGDLDAIVLKAMRHAPADRYASVAELAEDIRRHRELRPVRAHQGSRGYRLRRFVQRNKLGVASGAALTLALFAGAGGVAWQAHRAGIERDIARAELRRSEAALSAVTFLFRNASDAGQIQSLTARDMLEASARNLIATMRPDAPDTVDAVIIFADLYLVTENSAGAEAFLRRAMDAGVGKGDPVATARLQQRMGQVLASMGRVDDAKQMLDAADRVFRAEPARFRVERQDVIGARAFMLRVSGDREGGIKLLEDSLPEAEIAYADNPRELLTRYANLSTHYAQAGRLEQASALLARGERLASRTGSLATAPGLMIQLHQGTVQLKRGDAAGAYERYNHVATVRRELYGPSAGMGYDLVQVGTAQLALARYADAVKSLDEAIPMVNTYLGPTTEPAFHARIVRAEALAGLDRLSEAQTGLERVQADLANIDKDATANPTFMRARAALRIAQKRYGEARADLAAADRLLAANPRPDAYFRRRIDELRAQLP